MALIIWHEYFTPIIGKDQVEYMLDKYQSKESIAQQIKMGYDYYLLYENPSSIGYLGIKIIEGEELFLSKFYILAEHRHKGFGKQTFNFLEQLALKKNLKKISLTVNKYNAEAIIAYQHLGFANVGSIIQDIGNGFIMDDYKMEKIL
ncbi:GNAT family N-acetyltransferase [sulfur-oxidizing endosymbiont of Gigantopelta aegis]|uniref:GNAT family N-acetyltransferase n=1 Tax=sulfur-oxidizing endosymbiont of Gigantopelta aegis TaxID=2794934 RepID=UPI001FEC7FBC|nr:GNAT family N-acetyltransferase [sulfur-oxidizing endosymbiont of Gigantopelta aegis]